jgi:hypothetical protein
MKTTILDKPRLKSGKILKLRETVKEIRPKGQLPQKMVPGKSLEQIRLEAVEQLREMGLYI